MKFKISEVDANPFRHMERYPVREDKVWALRESIRSTSFWDNIVAREVDGRAQIAYGHHRLEALRREYSPDHEIDLIVRELSDELMLKIMANENMQEWGSSATIEHETVRSVVQAYADGRIGLAAPPAENRRYWREAPSFRVANERSEDFRPLHPYTANTVADFLGWNEPSGDPQRRVSTALAALEFIEDGTLAESAFADLSSYQASAVVQEARRARQADEARAKARQKAAEAQAKAAEKARKDAEKAERERIEAAERVMQARDEQARERQREKEAEARRKEAEARKAQREAQRKAEAAAAEADQAKAEGKKAATVVGTGLSEQLRSGKAGYATAERVGREIRNEAAPERPPTDIDDYARKIAGRLYRLFDPEHHELAKGLDELIKFRAHMSPGVLLNLSRELSSLVARVEEYRVKLAREMDEVPIGDLDLDVLDAEIVFESPEPKELTQ